MVWIRVIFFRHKRARGQFLLLFSTFSALGLTHRCKSNTRPLDSEVPLIWVGEAEKQSSLWTLNTGLQAMQQVPTDEIVWTLLNRLVSWAWSIHSLTNHTQCAEGPDFTSPNLFRDDKNCLIVWDDLNHLGASVTWVKSRSESWRNKENPWHLWAHFISAPTPVASKTTAQLEDCMGNIATPSFRHLDLPSSDWEDTLLPPDVNERSAKISIRQKPQRSRHRKGKRKALRKKILRRHDCSENNTDEDLVPQLCYLTASRPQARKPFLPFTLFLFRKAGLET